MRANDYKAIKHIQFCGQGIKNLPSYVFKPSKERGLDPTRKCSEKNGAMARGFVRAIGYYVLEPCFSIASNHIQIWLEFGK